MPDSYSITNPYALAGLFLIIPLIILYLLRPKPKHVLFPSIMLIRRIEKIKRFRSIFKRFVKDPLLLIQMAVVSLLVLGLAGPHYFGYAAQKEVKSVVLVLDASASMKAVDVKPSRFLKSLDEVREVLGSLGRKDRVSVVLAESVPVSAGRDMKPEEVVNLLSKLRASDTPSNIGDSILYAKDLLASANNTKQIYVFSDFAHQSGLPPLIARKRAMNENISVYLIPASGDSPHNIAITSLTSERLFKDKRSIFIAATVVNYGGRREAVKVNFKLGDRYLVPQTKTIEAGSEELFYTESPVDDKPQLVLVELEITDDLWVDNIAYTRVPEYRTYSVLLISNKKTGGDQYIRYALEAAGNIRYMNAAPPVTPKMSSFDAVIFGDFDSSKILPGTYDDLRALVDRGGGLVVASSNTLDYLKRGCLTQVIPVKAGPLKRRETFVKRLVNHEVVDEREVDTQNIMLSSYWSVTAANGSQTLLTALDDTPLLAVKRYGGGRAAYVGLSSDPARSNFYYTSSYPIFWSRLVEWIARRGEVFEGGHYNTGDFLPEKAANSSVTTPSKKKIDSTNIFLDEAGVYKITSQSKSSFFTVNLLNPWESNLSTTIEKQYLRHGIRGSPEGDKVKIKKGILPYIIGLISAILLIEAIVYKRRGYL